MLTESEWSRGTDPLVLLELVRTRHPVAERRLRLFAVACSRRIWDWVDAAGRAAIEAAERYADGLVSPEELRAARLACKRSGGHAAWYAAASDPVIAARNAALSTQSGFAPGPDRDAERAVQAALLRDIFGNPLRAVLPVQRACLTVDALALAAVIYEDKAFERLPVLADTLESAGCRESAILAHCRGSGPHVRGCWVVDLLLGRVSERMSG